MYETEKWLRFVVTLKKSREIVMLNDEIPKRYEIVWSFILRDKIEINAMRVSAIFADVLDKNPDESKEVIRKRFKTNDELRSFKSCDNYGESATEDKTQEPEEIFKKRLIIVYKTEGDSPDANATPCEVSDAIDDVPIQVGVYEILDG